MKECRVCGEVKSLDEFSPRRAMCKPCVRIADNKRKALRREQKRAYDAEYRKNNKEKRNDYFRQYHLDNRDKKIAAAKQHYQENREERLQYIKDYTKANPGVKKAAESRRRQRRKVSTTAEDRQLSSAYRLAIANDPCFYCGAPGEHDDHKFPLAKGGTDHWWNLVRACSSCNLSKGARCSTAFALNRKEVLA